MLYLSVKTLSDTVLIVSSSITNSEDRRVDNGCDLLSGSGHNCNKASEIQSQREKGETRTSALLIMCLHPLSSVAVDQFLNFRTVCL